MAKRHKKLPETALPGIGAFAGIISLPALLFRSVATLDFGTVDIAVCGSLIIGKLCLIAASVACARMHAPKSASPGSVELHAGVLGLLTTNSDDLGLGLPVLGAIFPPDLVSLCFVLNAFQTSLLNPIICARIMN